MDLIIQFKARLPTAHVKLLQVSEFDDSKIELYPSKGVAKALVPNQEERD